MGTRWLSLLPSARPAAAYRPLGQVAPGTEPAVAEAELPRQVVVDRQIRPVAIPHHQPPLRIIGVVPDIAPDETAVVVTASPS